MDKPKIADSALMAKDSTVCGKVTLGERCNVWFHATVRAEISPITVGAETNIQDNCVLHTDPGMPLTIGRRVTVGHGSILHGCDVADGALIGMGSVVLNNAKIGKNCYIGAGSLVTQGTVIPDGMMAFGRPAKPVRPVSEAERESVETGVDGYIAEAEDYRADGLFRSGAE